MTARASHFAGFVDQPLVIGSASPWDIFFLLSEVAPGAAAGHFRQSLGNLRSQKFLTMQCAKAIVSRLWLFRRFLISDQFVVARHATYTVGAALAHAERNADGNGLVTLEYLVVDPRFRQHGVGQALVQHFMANAPAGTVVRCFCTPKSPDMQRLLRRLGFQRTQKATLATSQDELVLLPHVWEWRR